MKASGPRLLAVAAAPLFCLAAIANSAGYRYGVSDLSFYLPAAFRDADPRLFPRDGALLDVQARLTLADDALAAALRTGGALGISEPAVVYGLHIATLLLLFAAAVSLGAALFRSRWSVAAFVAALTLRHAVGRTGVNTLEGYFHPRMVAFALAVLGFSWFLRRGPWPAIAIGLVAMAIHTTTGFWFLVCVGVAALASDRRERLPLLALATAAALGLAYAVAIGPLAGRFQPMDGRWLAALGERDYLFPDRWPLSAWVTAAAYAGAIAAAAVVRARDGGLSRRERGLVVGAAALLVAFAIAMPLLVGRRALAVQLQPARVFWILDLMATAAVVWIAESGGRRQPARVPAVLAILLIAASTARGMYLMGVRFPERSIAAFSPVDSPWQDVMRWAARTDSSSHWLAHPNHAFLYGSSLRVTGRRDVFIEATKDPAVAMYDRDVAMRVAERLPLVANFDGMTANGARTLARRYGLDFMVTESDLPLPLAYRRARLNVYRLR